MSCSPLETLEVGTEDLGPHWEWQSLPHLGLGWDHGTLVCCLPHLCLSFQSGKVAQPPTLVLGEIPN